MITTAAGGLLVVALAVMAVGVALPVVAPEVQLSPIASGSSGEPVAAASAHAQASGRRSVSLQQLMAVCSRDWQRPLFDSPEQIAAEQAAQQGATARPAPPLSAQLVGTIVEAGRSMAVFAMADGSFDICGEGESIDQSGSPLTVKHVARRKVTIQYNGAEHELELPEPPTPMTEGQ